MDLTLHPRIDANPAIMVGKPVIRGSRVPVEVILRECARGATVDEILREYPRLAAEDVGAALAFAADFLRDKSLAAAE